MKIGGISVGGMNAETARVHVERVYGRAVLFTYGKESWRARPSALGARPQIGRAVHPCAPGQAREEDSAAACPSTASASDGYVARLDNRLSEPASDAYLVGLSDFAPVIARGPAGAEREPGDDDGADRHDAPLLPPHADRAGRRAGRAAGHAGELRAGHRRQDQVARAPLLRGRRAWTPASRSRPGSPRTRRRSGSGRSSTMRRDPWWIPPPDSKWAQGAKPIPPGPGNPLGTRWMGLSAPYVGIHGTPDAASLGYSQSHGCIRMAISRRGVGLRPRPARDAGLHRLCLSASLTTRDAEPRAARAPARCSSRSRLSARLRAVWSKVARAADAVRAVRLHRAVDAAGAVRPRRSSPGRSSASAPSRGR